MFSLTEDQATGRWESRDVCFGGDKYCTGSLKGDFARHILSFGEDETGTVEQSPRQAFG